MIFHPKTRPKGFALWTPTKGLAPSGLPFYFTQLVFGFAWNNFISFLSKAQKRKLLPDRKKKGGVEIALMNWFKNASLAQFRLPLFSFYRGSS